MADSPTESRIDAALFRLRIIWLAMILGQLAFIGIAYLFIKDGFEPIVGGELAQSMFYAAMGTFALGLVGGYILRMQTYKRCWLADRVTPEGYFMGNLMLYAIMEAVSIFGVVVVLLSGQLAPHIVPAAAALLVMAINFPGGGPMRDASVQNLM